MSLNRLSRSNILRFAQFKEYCEVMAAVGMGEKEMGLQNLRTLYHVADKDGNGSIGE